MIQGSYLAKFDEREMKIAGKDTASRSDKATGDDTTSVTKSSASAADCRPWLDFEQKG